MADAPFCPRCSDIHQAGVRICPNCGYDFGPQPGGPGPQSVPGPSRGPALLAGAAALVVVLGLAGALIIRLSHHRSNGPTETVAEPSLIFPSRQDSPAPFFHLPPLPATGPAVDLGVAFRNGTTYRYQASVELNATVTLGDGSGATVHGVAAAGMTLRITAVGNRGMATGTLEVQPETGQAGIAQGQPVVAGPAGPMRIRIDRTGEFLSGGGWSLIQVELPALWLPWPFTLGPAGPDATVRPGGRWSRTVTGSFPLGSGSVGEIVAGRFDGYQDFQGTKGAARVLSGEEVPFALVVDPSVAGPPGSALSRAGQMSFSGVADGQRLTYLDVASHALLFTQFHATLTVAATASGLPNNAAAVRGVMNVTIRALPNG